MSQIERGNTAKRGDVTLTLSNLANRLCFVKKDAARVFSVANNKFSKTVTGNEINWEQKRTHINEIWCSITAHPNKDIKISEINSFFGVERDGQGKGDRPVSRLVGGGDCGLEGDGKRRIYRPVRQTRTPHRFYQFVKGQFQKLNGYVSWFPAISSR